MDFIFNTFSNRELSSSIWLILVFSLFLFKKDIRTTVGKVIKIALNPKIVLYFCSFLLYMSGIIFILKSYDIWNFSFLKDSILWFLFSGLVIGFDASTRRIEKGFWTGIIIDNIKIIVFLEFIIGSYTFPLIGEIFLVPFVSFIVLLNVVSSTGKKSKPVEKITTVIQSLIGLIIIFSSAYMAVTDYQSFGEISTLKSFLLPFVLTLTSIPYVFLFVIIVLYEQIFIRLTLGIKRSRKLNFMIKVRLMLHCLLSIKKLNIVLNMSNYNIMSISSKDDIKDMIRTYKRLSSESLL